MFEVFLVNFGYTKSNHSTLEQAVQAAKKTGFQCVIYKKNNPFKILKWVSPV
jgi:hypothetical protein